MDRSVTRLCALSFFLLMAAAGSGSWAQAQGGRDEIIRRMIGIVIEHNPILASQQELVRESQGLPELRSRVALTGMSLSLATSVWDPNTGTFRLFPAATVGTSLSIADPARALNAYNLKKEREAARQEFLKTRDSLVADLLSTVREILKLVGRREKLEKLRTYLRDYGDLIEKQVRAGVESPAVDKLWDLKERLLTTEAELGDVEDQLGTIGLEAALRLAGDSWRELQELLASLGG